MPNIGIDIIHIPFISAMVKKHGKAFVERYLSDVELKEFNRKARKKTKYEYLAGRFAAKEAFYKATNLRIRPKDISIINDEVGKPYIIFNNKKEKNIKKNCISISHHREYAIAIVYWEED